MVFLLFIGGAIMFLYICPPPDNGELTVLPAGRHEYPFSFQLPEE